MSWLVRNDFGRPLAGLGRPVFCVPIATFLVMDLLSASTGIFFLSSAAQPIWYSYSSAVRRCNEGQRSTCNPGQCLKRCTAQYECSSTVHMINAAVSRLPRQRRNEGYEWVWFGKKQQSRIGIEKRKPVQYRAFLCISFDPILGRDIPLSRRFWTAVVNCFS